MSNNSKENNFLQPQNAQPLYSKKNWVNWKLKQKEDGTWTKVPYKPNNYKASHSNPDTWSPIEKVVAKVKNFSGIGIVFDGTFFGIDLDKILVNGKVVDEPSQELLKKVNTYVETSPSGTGLHILFELSEPFELLRNKYNTGRKSESGEIKYECYNTERFFTFTGKEFEGSKPIRKINKKEAVELLGILGYSWGKKEKVKEITETQKSNKLPEEIINELLSKEKFQRYFNLDDSEKDGDKSSADMAFMCGIRDLADRDPVLMKEVFLMTPRSKREKVAKRKDYLDGLVQGSLEYEKNNNSEKKRNIEFLISNGKAVLNTENVVRLLNTLTEIKLDIFTQKIYIKNDLGILAELEENDYIKWQNKVACHHIDFYRVTKQTVIDAVNFIASQNTYDSAKEYFESLVWDKVNRLDTWLSKTYGVQDNEINRAIGSNWLKGLASRVHEAGCKFDYVLVIEGLQGSYKSTSLKILVGTNWHIEITISPNDKDFFLAMKGKLVVEFAEGETLSRSETKNLKSVITRDVDDIRLPYDRLTKSLPRRCVFAMTTNESQYLKDTTGNRRWLPVRVPDGHSADIEWLKENREQLLAEAYYRVTVLKEKTFEFPTEIEELQEDRVIMPDCVDAVLDYYNSLTWEEVKLGVITTEGVYNYINKNKSIEIQMRVMSPKEGNDIRKVLEGKLHLENKKISLNGFRRHRWLPTSKTKPPQTVVDENGFVVFPTDTEKVSAMSVEKEVKESGGNTNSSVYGGSVEKIDTKSVDSADRNDFVSEGHRQDKSVS